MLIGCGVSAAASPRPCLLPPLSAAAGGASAVCAAARRPVSFAAAEFISGAATAYHSPIHYHVFRQMRQMRHVSNNPINPFQWLVYECPHTRPC